MSDLRVDRTYDRPETVLLVLEHDDLSAFGGLHDWAAERAVSLAECRADAGSVPDPVEFDGLIVLGCVESAYDDRIQSWFRAELAAIQSAVASGIPTFGVCFGAQALSIALGGSVHRAPFPEIGWTPIRTRQPGVVGEGPWMQWHHDTFTLPPGGRLWADTDAGIQTFSHGVHLGVQFHPEVTLDVLRMWVDDGRVELQAHGIDPDELLADGARFAPAQQMHAYELFDRFLANTERPSARTPTIGKPH